MMSGMSQTEMHENHPLYREILKTILKSQIQMLVDQLSTQIGEETVILSASIKDGNITDIGTKCGRDFLKGHCAIKTDFLGFCIQRHFERQSDETEPVLASNKSIYEKSRSNQETVSHLQSPVQTLNTKQNKSRGKRKHGSYDSTMQEWDSRSNEYDLSAPTTNAHKENAHDAPRKMNQLDEEVYLETETTRPDVTEAEQTECLSKLDPRDSRGSVDDLLRERDESSDLTRKHVDGSVSVLEKEADQPLSLQDQISSKRKQHFPKRIKIESEDPPMEVTDLPSDLPIYSVDECTENDHLKPSLHEYKWSVERINDLNVSPVGKRATENGFYSDGYGLGTGLVPPTGSEAKHLSAWSYESSPNFDLSHKSRSLGGLSSEDIYTSSINPDVKEIKNHASNSFQDDQMNISANNSPKPIDGILVTRGSGRLEKLLKCELCGKVCRTSNMSRHKKRYCLGYPKVRLMLNDYK